MPVFGVVLAKMLGLLSMPLEYFGVLYPGDPDYLKDTIHMYCLYMSIVATLSGLGSFL
jgi:hypothetical protein